jgi:hypothetical protein
VRGLTAAKPRLKGARVNDSPDDNELEGHDGLGMLFDDNKNTENDIRETQSLLDDFLREFHSDEPVEHSRVACPDAKLWYGIHG